MTAPVVLDGKKVRDFLLDNIGSEIVSLKEKTGDVPGLAVILVGDNAASRVYVASKKKTCERLGMQSFEYVLPVDVDQESLSDLIRSLNHDVQVHGILLQLPLPDHLDADLCLQLISPDKDVDGFHPVNVGNLLIGTPTFISCTPYGVCELMKFYDIDPAGKHVVILGRSNIVGKPLAALLMQKASPGNATVTVCHSRSSDLNEQAKSADILIAAIGKPLFVTADMVKEGAVVIDVGINRIEDNTHPKGSRLVGDVDYESVSSKVSAITPVPGGVGPLTIAMLMSNTLQSFKRFKNS